MVALARQSAKKLFNAIAPRHESRREGFGGLESLERRQMMALVGVTPDVPLFTYNSTGVVEYEDFIVTFDIEATPLLFVPNNTDPPVFVGAPPSLLMSINVDNSGNLIGGIPGEDFIITGSVDLNGDTIPEYSGVLLTGEVAQFGWQESGATDQFDMRFTVSGGDMETLYSGKDLGVTVTSENSTFNGVFTESFIGGAKGNVGAIDKLKGSLNGVKYRDKTGDGQSADDSPLGGTTINLFPDRDNNGLFTAADEPLLASTVTAVGTGAYSFTNLTPGLYFVQEVVPAGYAQTGPTANNGVYAVNVTPGGNSGGFDFTNVELSCLDGKKFKDKTGNGLSGDDTAFGGVTINLFLDRDNSGTLNGADSPAVGSTVTAANGSYSFNNLLPGRYFVQEVVPAGYQQTAPTANGGIYIVNVTPGSNTKNLDFANVKLGKISGKKYKDLCGDGLTSDDTGLGGTTIKLFRDANNDGVLTGADGGPIATTVTVSSGFYSFNDLLPGRYFVQEVVPTGYIRTHPTLSDTYTVNLTPGEEESGKNFANFKKDDCKCDLTNVKYYIDGKLYYDLRGNSHQGDTVKVTFTVKPGETVKLSLVSYKAPGPVFVASEAAQQTIFDVETKTFGPGTWSMTVTIPNCYYQVDFVCGCPITKFGPAGSNIFYTPQERLISADNGGVNSCVENMSAKPSFWASSTGQQLIKKFNATSSNSDPTTLGNWLASNFPKIYGSGSPNNMSGKKNSQVASLMQSLNSSSSKALDAQVLATALSVYATDSDLGGAASALFGFSVSSSGLGAAKFNVLSNGSAFGVSNNTSLSVMQLLQGVNSKAVNGSLYNGSSTLKSQALDILSDVTKLGGVA